MHTIHTRRLYRIARSTQLCECADALTNKYFTPSVNTLLAHPHTHTSSCLKPITINISAWCWCAVCECNNGMEITFLCTATNTLYSLFRNNFTTHTNCGVEAVRGPWTVYSSYDFFVCLCSYAAVSHYDKRHIMCCHHPAAHARTYMRTRTCVIRNSMLRVDVVMWNLIQIIIILWWLCVCAQTYKHAHITRVSPCLWINTRVNYVSYVPKHTHTRTHRPTSGGFSNRAHTDRGNFSRRSAIRRCWQIYGRSVCCLPHF